MKQKMLSLPYWVWSLVFIIVPLIMIFLYGMRNRSGEITLDNIIAVTSPEHSKALILSLILALIATVICLLLAYPLALIMDSMNINIGSFIIFLFILPMWMNFLLRTLAWQTLLEKSGVINTILGALHLPLLNIINTPSAIILGMVYNYLPFMVLPIYNSVSKIDRDVINAARDLGADNATTLFKVIIPLTIPGIISGITMVFIPALTTFVLSDMLGGGKILLIGNIIEQAFTQASNWYLGSGLSIVLMAFIILNMVVTNILDREGEQSLL